MLEWAGIVIGSDIFVWPTHVPSMDIADHAMCNIFNNGPHLCSVQANNKSVSELQVLAF